MVELDQKWQVDPPVELVEEVFDDIVRMLDIECRKL
jgi:hypothetical protein